MQEFKNFSFEGNVYTVKDETARNKIASLEERIGNINVESQDITIDETLDSSSSNAIANKAVASEISQVKSDIQTLNGTGNGSVSKLISDKVAEIIADAPESLDTLKEISDWISKHENDAASMNSQIQQNESDISEVKQDVSSLDTKVTGFKSNFGMNMTASGSLNVLYENGVYMVIFDKNSIGTPFDSSWSGYNTALGTPSGILFVGDGDGNYTGDVTKVQILYVFPIMKVDLYCSIYFRWRNRTGAWSEWVQDKAGGKIEDLISRVSETEKEITKIKATDYGAGRNLIKSCVSYSNTSVTYDAVEGYTVTATKNDNRAYITRTVWPYKNGSYVGENNTKVVYQVIKSNGYTELTLTKDSSFDEILLGHSGGQININCRIDVSHLKDGEDYILSFNILNYDSTNTLKFNRLMIREAKYADDTTFYPYIEDNLELTHDVDGVRGVGRNLLKITSSTKTVDGVKFTPLSNGGVSVSGTSTGSNAYDLVTDYTHFFLPNGKYTFSLSGAGLSSSFYLVVFHNGKYYDAEYANSFSRTFEVTDASQYVRVYLRSTNGATENATVYPMLRLAKYDDPTFYPYSQNEIEFQQETRQTLANLGSSSLTYEKGSWTPEIGGINNVSIIYADYYRIGGVVHIRALCRITGAIISDVVAYPDGYDFGGLPYTSQSENSICIDFLDSMSYPIGRIVGIITHGTFVYFDRAGIVYSDSQFNSSISRILISGTYIID